MDTPQKSPGLASIRTFAKDLEMKKLATAPAGSVGAAPAAPLPEATLVAGEHNVYQAPKWKKRKTGPTENPEVTETNTPPVPLKKIPEPTLKPLSAPKSASEPTIIVDNEDAASATIIRDTKYNRFRLFPAIGSSLIQWFKDFKENHFTKKAPKYTVPETTLRKGVIQKATSKTGKIATFDHSSLQERIRERQDRVAPKTPTTTWTANTEPGFLLLEEPEGVVNVQVEPRKSFRTVTPAPKPVEPVPVPVPAPTPTPTPTPVVPEEPVTVPPTPPVSVEEPEPAPTLPTIVPPEEPPTTPNTTPVPGVTLRDWLFSMNTNVMSLGVTGLVVAVIIVSAVGFFWFRSEIGTEDFVTRPDHPTLLNAPVSLLYVDELAFETLHNGINDELAKQEATLVQLGVVATKDGTTLVPVPAVLELMNFDVSAVFGRSIATLYFGRLANGSRFIVFKTTDATTARGGMLAWEDSLYKDTLPILSHGASARNLPNEAAFSDAVVQGADARVLAIDGGEEYLVYTLTKDNTVIITTTQAALTELFTVLK